MAEDKEMTKQQTEALKKIANARGLYRKELENVERAKRALAESKKSLKTAEKKLAFAIDHMSQPDLPFKEEVKKKK